MRTETTKCRYGTMTYYPDDEFVGKSLHHYGEFSDAEIGAMRITVKPGDTVIDAGANVGALTLGMADIVGPTGRVIAFEPQPENYALLARNVKDNGLVNVTVYNCALGSKVGTVKIATLDKVKDYNFGGVEVGDGDVAVGMTTIDSLNLDRVTFIKVDVEGMERDVIAGARETIKRCRPFMLVENDRAANANALTSDLVDLGYRLYWMRPLLYSPENFRGEKRNVFAGIISLNMICVPRELNATVSGCDEIADLRMDDQMYERELARFQAVVDKNPNDRLSLLQVAHYSHLTRRTKESRRILEQMLETDPNDAAARTILGLFNIQAGVWDWAGYEARYGQANVKSFGGDRAPVGVPHWDGRVTNEPVLLWAEQGFGDSIMFGRFIAEARKRAPNLYLEVQPQLYELFETSKVVDVGNMIRLGRTRPEVAFHCALPSLGWALDVDTKMVEKYSESYLRADPAMVKVWADRGAPKVGICVAGSPRSERPYSRDIDKVLLKSIIEDFGPLMTLDNVGQFDSFADTAAAVMHLDIVISVDTAIAHLAGSLGKPVILLLSHDPDWRWGLEGATTIWYPTMRICRQPKLFAWEPALAEAHAYLTTLTRSKAA